MCAFGEYKLLQEETITSNSSPYPPTVTWAIPSITVHLISLLQLQWPLCQSSANTLASGRYSCCFLCSECPSPRELHSLSPHFLSVICQTFPVHCDFSFLVTQNCHMPPTHTLYLSSLLYFSSQHKHIYHCKYFIYLIYSFQFTRCKLWRMKTFFFSKHCCIPSNKIVPGT